MRTHISKKHSHGITSVAATCATATLRVDNGPEVEATVENVKGLLDPDCLRVILDSPERFVIQRNTKTGNTWVRFHSKIDEVLAEGGPSFMDVLSNDPLGAGLTVSDCLKVGLEMILQEDDRLGKFNTNVIVPVLVNLRRCQSILKGSSDEDEVNKVLECLRKVALYRTSERPEIEAKLPSVVNCMEEYLEACEDTTGELDPNTRAWEILKAMPLQVKEGALVADYVSTFHEVNSADAAMRVDHCCRGLQIDGVVKPPKNFEVVKTSEFLITPSRINYTGYRGCLSPWLYNAIDLKQPVFLADTIWVSSNSMLEGGRYLEMSLTSLFKNVESVERAQEIWKTYKVPYNPETHHNLDRVEPALNWAVNMVSAAMNQNEKPRDRWREYASAFCAESLMRLCSRAMLDLQEEMPEDMKQAHMAFLKEDIADAEITDSKILEKHREWMKSALDIINKGDDDEIDDLQSNSVFRDCKTTLPEFEIKETFRGLLINYGVRLAGETSESKVDYDAALDRGYEALGRAMKVCVLKKWLKTLNIMMVSGEEGWGPSRFTFGFGGNDVDKLTPFTDVLLGFEKSLEEPRRCS